MDKKKPPKQWTEKEAIELDNLYSSLHWSFADLAKRFHCTGREVRRKVREMGIEQ